jgi:group I intron endonuclease
MDIETRWKTHRDCKKYSCGSYLLNAYLKYGIENFKFQIICICFDEACNQLEIDYIKKFNTLAPNGYNLDSGGKNSKSHPDTKKKLSELNKGEKNPQFGRVWTQEEIDAIWTPEFREKRIKQTTGKGNPNYGKASVHRKEVGMFNKDDILLQRFKSIHEASEETFINEGCISGVCNGRQKTAGGFVWKFL